MWRKFNRSKDPAIGSPTLIETTFDQQYLDTIPEVDSLRSGGPSRRTSLGLPELPFKVVEPLARPDRASADHRASSLYSQPGQETLRTVPQGSDRLLSVYSEVSPLTSPRGSADLDAAESPDVSPIEPPPASQDVPKLDPKLRTHLPIPRKLPPASDSASTDSGASPSVRREPKESVGGPELSEEERLTMLREKDRKLLSGFQERPSVNSKDAVRPRREDSLDHPVYREPWKGASGRTALVEPVRTVPRPKHDTGPVAKRRSVIKDPSAHTVVTVPASRSTSAEPTSPITSIQPPEPTDFPDEPIKPTAPLKVGNNKSRIRSPVTTEKLSGPFNPRYSDATVSSFEPTPSDIGDGSRDESKVIPPTSQQQRPTGPLPDTTSHPRPQTADDDPTSRFSWTTSATTFPPKTPEIDPLSRFSWTTYATSDQESPRTMAQRDIDTPPVPPIPYMPNAMAMRKRPMPSHTTDANSISKLKINRKPTPSNIASTRSSSLPSTTAAAAT
ncbi:hypothetical protein EPUS_00043 [Endocarpon pusillum Z07020]|uniref:Uncharacterized protein n=1 Tax=Endocarpon pusillum (strain Z07020 / HMAS-L-300199) TaxID=1263415 RepID=U1GTB1_ENDPU|nr:uncharacterized protein EPUS_00043 [Endocarpon pusillum Z07020]ERF75251.1 hypothetical protein EPUS_00043 [Endocarpon pusillum Z07020]